MHIHWFRKTKQNSVHEIVGRHPIHRCRCGIERARMLGGYGYSTNGGAWYDRPVAPSKEK